MNPIRAIGRAAGVLAGLAAGLITLATAAPSALARPRPASVTPTALATPRPLPLGWNKDPPVPAHVHALTTSGMPGWQLALIAAATAILAVGAVLWARARAARRRAAASPA